MTRCGCGAVLPELVPELVTSGAIEQNSETFVVSDVALSKGVVYLIAAAVVDLSEDPDGMTLEVSAGTAEEIGGTGMHFDSDADPRRRVYGFFHRPTLSLSSELTFRMPAGAPADALAYAVVALPAMTANTPNGLDGVVQSQRANVDDAATHSVPYDQAASPENVFVAWFGNDKPTADSITPDAEFDELVEVASENELVNLQVQFRLDLPAADGACEASNGNAETEWGGALIELEAADATACDCSVVATDCVTWSGDGSPGDPYVPELVIDPDPENLLECRADGLYGAYPPEILDKPRVRVTGRFSGAVSPGGTTATFDTPVSNAYGLWTPAFPERLTASFTGMWEVYASVAGGAEVNDLEVRRNGVTPILRRSSEDFVFDPSNWLCGQVFLTAGQWVTLFARQFSPTFATFGGTFFSFPQFSPIFGMIYKGR